MLVPSGQTLSLPAGSYNGVYILADAVGGDVVSASRSARASKTAAVREWQGPVGQWWSRLKDIAPSLREPFAVQKRQQPASSSTGIRAPGIVTGIDQIRPAFVKRDEIAWIATHRHDPSGNEPYVSGYVFKYAFDLPAGVREVKLPNDSRLRIFAVTVTNEQGGVGRRVRCIWRLP